MPKKVGPYIGVTGFMSNIEVSEVLAMVPTHILEAISYRSKEAQY